MAAISTVQDIISAARVLLQDTLVEYRYSDAELLDALNIAVFEARRLRPDMFIGTADNVVQYAAVDATALTAIEQQYRHAFLYYIVGHAQLRDEEDVTDSRAASLISSFHNKLVGTP